MKNKALLWLTTCLVFMLSSCGLLRMITVAKKLFKAPVVAQKDYKQQVKFHFRDGWIHIYARINGSDSLEFMLDSGAPSFIGDDVADSLKIKSKKLVARMGYCSANISIGGINYNNVGFLVHKVYDIKRLIGVNVMQNQIWSLNFKDSVLTISDNLAGLKKETEGYKIPFAPYGKQKTPVVKFVVNGTDTLKGFIDLGWSKEMDLNSLFNLTKLESSAPQDVATDYYKNPDADSKSPVSKSYTARLASVKIGGCEVHNVIATPNPEYKGMNLIGLQFLKNFIVTIDWIHDSVYLKPIPGRVVKSNKSSYGLYLFSYHHVVKVDEVVKGSYADKLGIKCGDTVDLINDIPAIKMSHGLFMQISDDEPCDKEITLKIRSMDKPVRLKKTYLFPTDQP